MMHFRRPRKSPSSTIVTVPDDTKFVPVSEWHSETSTLTPEEAEEIRLAFQQVLAMTDTMAAPFDALSMLSIDPLDLRELSISPEATPDLSQPIPPIDLTAIDLIPIETPIEVEADTEQVIEAHTESPTENPTENPPICEGFRQSAEDVEQIAAAVSDADLMMTASAASSAAVDALLLPLEPMPSAFAVDEMFSSIDVNGTSIETAEPADEPAAATGFAVDSTMVESLLSEFTANGDTQGDTQLDELDDLAIDQPDNALSPLSYFQTYAPDQPDEAEGPNADYSSGAWRQPSMPAGLIGAGVLGATLISGFMIADAIKQPLGSQAKKPPLPSPIASLSSQGQTPAMAKPKPTAPEMMKPEMLKTESLKPLASLPPLPPANTMSPIFPALPPMAMASNPPIAMETIQAKAIVPPAAIVTQPIARSTQSTAKSIERSALPAPATVERAGSVAAPFEPVITPVETPIVPPPPESLVREPVTSPVVTAPVTPPMGRSAPIARTAPKMPVLEPNVVGRAADLAPIDRVSDTPVITPERISPERISPERVAPEQVAPESAMSSPTEFIFEANPIKANPVAPTATTSRLGRVTNTLVKPAPVAPALQTLLTPPSQGYDAGAASLRSLSQSEAAMVAESPQLGGFSRQTLSQREYLQAYRSLSQELKALPPYGFIDYQRQIILLPSNAS